MTVLARQGYRFGPYRLDATDRLLYRNGELVPLAPKVADTLLLLVSSGGRVLTKEEMIGQLWPDTFVEEGTLTQYVSLLRKALGEDGGWIENLPRRGYRFTAPVEEAGVEAVAADGAAPERLRRGRIAAGGLVALLALAVSSAAWINRRPEPAASFQSVAVLPFRAVSGAPVEYLADAIAEALIGKLTGLKGLRVVSYSRVRRFKGSSEEAAAIGRQLGVAEAIEGTVRVSEGRLRISMQGVDTATGYTIWAIERFEARPDRLLDIEGQIAEAAALRVRGQLTAGERILIAQPRAANAEAYDLVLKARGAAPASAMGLLERAIELDPSYAEAYGWLALAQIHGYQASGNREMLRKAITSANFALSRDPDCSIAVRALVAIHHSAGREIEGLVMARRALENNPEDPDAMAAAAEAYFRTGLYDRAIPLYEKALAMDPSNSLFRSQLARMYLYLGRHRNGIDVISSLPLSEACCFGMLLYAETGQMAKAVEIARTSPKRPPGAFHAYLRGYVLASAGDAAGAREMWADGLRRSTAANAEANILNSMLYAKLGRKEEALESLQRSLDSDPQNPVLLFFAAQVRALLGLRREALATLNASARNGFFNLPLIEFHTRRGLSFHDVRDEPEFHSMRAGLARRIEELRARY